MPARQKPDAPAATSTMNKCVRAATIRYEITPSAGNGPLERQFCPSTEFAGEPRIMGDRYRNPLKKYDSINDIVCGLVNQRVPWRVAQAT